MITARKRIYGKVMFLQPIHRRVVHHGMGHIIYPQDTLSPIPLDTLPRLTDLCKTSYLRPYPLLLTSGGHHERPAHFRTYPQPVLTSTAGQRSKQYASYWNAFLFKLIASLRIMGIYALSTMHITPQCQPSKFMP